MFELVAWRKSGITGDAYEMNQAPLPEVYGAPLRLRAENQLGYKMVAFRKSQGKKDDGAELYVNEAGERNGVVAMRPERREREAELASFLRHELTLLHDRIDPGFGYVPDLPVQGPSLNQQRLARERYCSLWDGSIDGRLT